MSAVCFLLPSMLESGIALLEKAVKFQDMIEKQVLALISLTDLQTYLDLVPDSVDFTLDSSALNEIMASCPDIFPDLPSINLTFFNGWKKYLNFLKGSPLGILSSLMASLNAFMSPIPALITTLRAYVTCLVAVCGLSIEDAAAFNATINGYEASLNLVNGKSQILASDPTSANILATYENRVEAIKTGMNTYK